MDVLPVSRMSAEQQRVLLQVLVTGASGKTGALVVSQLLKLTDQYEVRTLVRSTQASNCGVLLWP